MDKQVLKMKKAPLEADRKKADDLYNLLIVGADKGQKAGARSEAQKRADAKYKAKRQAKPALQKEEVKKDIKIAKEEGKIPSRCVSNRIQNARAVAERGAKPDYTYKCHIPVGEAEVNKFLQEQAQRSITRKNKYVDRKEKVGKLYRRDIIVEAGVLPKVRKTAQDMGRQNVRAMKAKGLKSNYADEQRAGQLGEITNFNINNDKVIKYLTPLDPSIYKNITVEQTGGLLRLNEPNILIGGQVRSLITPTNMLIDDRNINGLNM